MTAAVDGGYSMKDLTVLAVQNDPFRIDTPARHRDGEWLAATARELGLGDRRIHLRGLHYMVIGRPKPDGSPYTNTDADWLWLSGDAGKAARWLGYIPFDQIVDQRNAAPDIRVWLPPQPVAYVNVGVTVELPDAAELQPRVGVYGFIGTQPYKIVFFGEKSSLADVLTPIAQAHEADLYLPTGEISDTMLHTMARIGADDGRPMVVLCFSDADPAGWQMPISITRKLQAFKASLYPELEFQVHNVALTPDQVREYGLPSTPLKPTERRADRWRQAMGVEQTEIDALASLQPDLLRRIARDAIGPFYDSTLVARVWRAYDDWRRRAQAVVDANLDDTRREQLRVDATEKLTAMREQIDEINQALRVDVDDFDLPEPVIPAADVTGITAPAALCDSSWGFTDQTRRLISHKAYENGSADDPLVTR